jgi:hypothetical protein
MTAQRRLQGALALACAIAATTPAAAGAVPAIDSAPRSDAPPGARSGAVLTRPHVATGECAASSDADVALIALLGGGAFLLGGLAGTQTARRRRAHRLAISNP